VVGGLDMVKKYPNKNFRVLKGGVEGKGSKLNYKKWIFYLIIGVLAFFIVGHMANNLRDYITAKLLEIEVVEIKSMDQGIWGIGFYLREEKVLKGISKSQLSLPPNTRVRKGQNLFGDYVAPIAGLIVYNIDGYESFEFNNQNVLSVFKDIEQNYKEVAQGNEGVKIVNNYQTDIIVKIERKYGELLHGLSRVRVRLGNEEISQILFVDIKGMEQQSDYYLIHLFSDELKDDFLALRFSDVFFILDTITGIPLPQSAIVTKEGKTGVYVLQRNRVVFWEIAKIKEENGKIWVVGLRDNQQVILNPQIVNEGQWIKF
jgi:putative membrane fusion protein